MKNSFILPHTWSLILLIIQLIFSPVLLAEDGVTNTSITLGGIMDLEGRSSRLGQDMKTGLEAALNNQTVDGRKIRLLLENDSYTPEHTLTAADSLLRKNILLFIGNVGTPTTQALLPLLKAKQVPAFGFFTGSDILRGNQDNIVNFRANYAQETKAVISEALKHGLPANSLCAYMQSDVYGLGGIKGIVDALQDVPDTQALRDSLSKLLKQGEQNIQSDTTLPVGFYMRNTFKARDGYDALKAWEKANNKSCKLVITIGTYEAIGHFIAYAHSKGETWLYSAVSFTGAEGLLASFKKFGITDKVIMTQVVPEGSSDLPIVKNARAALGKNYSYVSQEGYIVGKLLLYGLKKLESTKQPLTRSNLMAVFKGQKFNLDGLSMDFTDDNQGSDLITMTHLEQGKWVSIDPATWDKWLQ